MSRHVRVSHLLMSSCFYFSAIKYAIQGLFLVKWQIAKYIELSIRANVYLSVCNIGIFLH